MRIHRDLLTPLAVVVAVIAVVGWRSYRLELGKPAASASQELRLAYFPNLTHAPALVGVARGSWQERLKGARLSVKLVNAGPEAMEAMLAGELDMAFVGPSPAINAYLKSGGKAIRIVSGACLGGASLVRRHGAAIKRLEDLSGKRIAVPQMGGTQDVSCRHFLASVGLRGKDQGGDVEIMAVKNPDILSLFKQGHLDAAWVPEPWASRLREEAGAETVIDESALWPSHRFSTTCLVVRKAFLDARPELVDQALAAHLETLQWMKSHDREARDLANDVLKRLTGKALKAPVLAQAWSKLSFTADPDMASVKTFAQAAREAGYVRETVTKLAGLFDPRALRLAARLEGATPVAPRAALASKVTTQERQESLPPLVSADSSVEAWQR